MSGGRDEQPTKKIKTEHKTPQSEAEEAGMRKYGECS
jgi:hypothetical protein